MEKAKERLATIKAKNTNYAFTESEAESSNRNNKFSRTKHQRIHPKSTRSLLSSVRPLSHQPVLAGPASGKNGPMMSKKDDFSITVIPESQIPAHIRDQIPNTSLLTDKPGKPSAKGKKKINSSSESNLSSSDDGKYHIFRYLCFTEQQSNII